MLRWEKLSWNRLFLSRIRFPDVFPEMWNGTQEKQMAPSKIWPVLLLSLLPAVSEPTWGIFSARGALLVPATWECSDTEPAGASNSSWITNSSSHAHEVPTNNSSQAIARFRRLTFALYHEAGLEINPEVLPLVSTCIKCREANGIIPVAGWFLRSFRDIVNMEVLPYRWNGEEDFLFGFILKSATDLGL